MSGKKRSGWILPGILIGFYAVIKLQGWMAAQEVKSLERQLAEIRPGLSAIVLSEQLESTRRACEEVTFRVRQMELKNSRLLERISGLPASITLSKLDVRSRLTLPVQGTFSLTAGGAGIRSRYVTRIQGTLLPGVRDPEMVLLQWAQSLQEQGARVVIQRLAPSFQTPGLWEFDLEVEDA